MRGANRLPALLAVLALAVAARAEERKPDPLEAADSACAEGARSTADMANCEYASYKRWDAELNRVYAALRAKLDAAGQQALKESQQKWLVYRDAERKTIGAVFDRLEGTMYVPMRAGAARDVVKARVTDLRGYLELLDEGAP